MCLQCVYKGSMVCLVCGSGGALLAVRRGAQRGLRIWITSFSACFLQSVSQALFTWRLSQTSHVGVFSSEGNELNIFESVCSFVLAARLLRAERGKEDAYRICAELGIEHRCTRPLLELLDLFVRGSPRFKFDPNKGQPILVMVMTQACCLLVEVHVCVGGVNPCFQGICDFSAFQFFSFKAGGSSSPFSLAPTKTLDECWWYLTWSVRRTCHETISISEFCDSFTAATVLNLSLFKTCLSTTAFSRAKNHKSIWASWTDILSYKCVTGRDSVMALSWSWLSQAIESPPLKRISKILKWTLWIVSVSWPQIRILWFSPYQSTSVNMKHTQLDWDSFSIFLVVPLSE